jgi:hypothetical protein
MNKPSVSWPVDPIKEGGRVARTHSDPLLKPCHADSQGADKNITGDIVQIPPTYAEKHGDYTPVGSKEETCSASSVPLKSQKKASLFDGGKSDPAGRRHGRGRDENRSSSNAMPTDDFAVNNGRGPSLDSIPDLDDIDFWQPSPPKVLMKNPRDVPLELRSQIQHYATTE